MRTYPISFDDKLWEEFRKICKQKKITIAEVFRRHVKVFIASNGDVNGIADNYKKLDVLS